MARRIAIAWALLGLTACPANDGPPPIVEVMGCAEWPNGEACAVTEKPLTLWVDRAVEVTLDGERLEPTAVTNVQGGSRFEIAPRPGALVMRAEKRRPFELKLVAHEVDAELAEVARLRRSGALAEAEARLAALTSTVARFGLHAEAARNALAANRIDEARASFEAAIAQDVRAGRPRAELMDRTALAYLFIHNGSAALAREQLDALAPLAEAFAEAATLLDYFEAKLHAPRPALAALQRLIVRAERLDYAEVVLDAHQMRASLLRLLGRWAELAETLGLMRRALERDWSACKEAQVHSNLGWYGLIGHRQAPAFFPDAPDEALSRARDLYSERCPRPRSLANVELNLGWAALFAGRFEAAKRALAASSGRVPEPSPDVRVDRLHLEAEIHLASRDFASAAEAFAELDDLAARVGEQFIRWRAVVGLGEAKEGLGDRAAAIALYREGEHRLSALAEQVPVGEGRDGALFERSIGAERLVAALTEQGDAAAAIDAIRRARRGVFRWARFENDLERQDRGVEWSDLQVRLRAARAEVMKTVAASWALSDEALAAERYAADAKARAARAALDALLTPRDGASMPPRAIGEVLSQPGEDEGVALPPLPEPGPDEASLFVHPSGEGVIAWLWTARGRYSAKSATRDLGGLDALAPHLEGITRLAVYAHPELEAMDWAGWRVAGAPLYARARVVFVADLAIAERGPIADRRALVLADPEGSLPAAQAEGRAVAAALSEAGFDVTPRIGRARHAAVIDALSARWELWHYAGHGSQEGLDGIEGGLRVQDGARVSVSDILGLPRAPRRVVLAACDLGRRGTKTGAPGLGVVQALLLNGSEEVVAAVREVDDAHTTAWVLAFYAALADGHDFAEAARRARIALAERHPSADAGAFRVWAARLPPR